MTQPVGEGRGVARQPGDESRGRRGVVHATVALWSRRTRVSDGGRLGEVRRCFG